CEIRMAEIDPRQRGVPESRIREVCLSEIDSRQRGSIEVRIGEVQPGEVGAGKVVVNEANSAQVAHLVAGGGVELNQRNPAGAGRRLALEVRTAYLRAAKVRVGQRHTGEVGIPEVRSGEVGV